MAGSSDDDLEISIVINVALPRLIQSEKNIRDARDELDPVTIQRFNTDVLGLRYRTQIES